MPFVKPNPDRLSVLRKLDEEESFIVSPIFPCGSMHLVVGDSGIGKSSWTLQWLYDWSQGKAVLGGMVSHPCEWVYISTDRSLRDTRRTLRRLGLGDWDIPAYGVEEICNREDLSNNLVAPTLDRIFQVFPDVKFITLEGLQTVMPNTNRGQSQNKSESLWMLQTRETILNRGITILATEHIAKGSDQTGAVRTRRNKALGSAALIGAVGTIVSFDYPETTKTGEKTTQYTDERVVHINGHNFAPYSLQYTCNSTGQFILESSRSGVELASYVTEDDVYLQLDTQLSAWPYERPLLELDVLALGRICKMSDKQSKTWLRAMVISGMVEQVQKGEYRKVRTQ